ncbi:polyprenyl synthetase family protein [Nocardiopsis lambiniae]|uniref:Polyprenyl synthetase family protein n=1 Tax=Nocardiopsis lambiniae TaxID=3075539 RepID=A0ABU2MD42_9ACTN|nr:polyprenyl synthetase family protein [Nocardiopsis sp. DSM 44743]MDT0330602.1 polyprenyl synthetase family protein [Nocardiopsis sp. DSM 44743]
MSETEEQILLRTRVDSALREFARQETDRLLAIDADLTPVAEQLAVAVADGKRLRAAFCYWGWRAAGQPDSDALVRAAAAMELVHAAAVIHDDLIDESPMRHGVPSAHVALRAAFTARARPQAGGRALALLTGDLLMSWAAQLFLFSGLPAAYLSRARELWAVMTRELIAGECLEVLRTGSRPDTDRSLQVIRYKTAKYTVEHPLRIGGAMAGAPGTLMEAFTAYGLPLGEAFQLRDDLLGLFGDPRRTGKSNLDDVRGNRPTVLFAETWSAATAAERRELRGLLGRRGLDGEGLSRVRAITRRTGALDRVEKMIAQRVQAASTVLAQTDLPAEASAALSHMVASAASRRS